MSSSLDVQRIRLFLLVTFGAGWLIMIAARVSGLLPTTPQGTGHLAVLLAVLYTPLLGRYICLRGEGQRFEAAGRVWPIPRKPALIAIVGAPALFALMYAVSSALGEGTPQWGIPVLMQQLPSAEELGLEQSFPAGFFLIAGFILSIVLGPTLYALAWFGNELGWRDYLLPRLMPMGKAPAYALGGALWGVWLSPIVWLGYVTPDQRFMGTGLLILTAILLAFALGEVWRRTQHPGLAAVVMGCFFGQIQGMWFYLYPEPNLPWQGPFGLIAAVFWALTALALLLLPESYRLQPAPGVAAQTARPSPAPAESGK
ncbi:MAG: hypothetical protein ACLFU6_05040 [Candidatus Hydrogenedentota bacterium]